MYRYYCIPLVRDSDDTAGTELVGLPRLGHGAQGGAAHVEMGRLAGVEVAGAQVGDDDGHRLARARLVARALDLRRRADMNKFRQNQPATLHH